MQDVHERNLRMFNLLSDAQTKLDSNSKSTELEYLKQLNQWAALLCGLGVNLGVQLETASLRAQTDAIASRLASLEAERNSRSRSPESQR